MKENSDISYKKLKELEARYRSLVENSPDTIGIVCEGKLVFVNKKGFEIFGNVIGIDVRETVHPEDRERVSNDIKAVISGEVLPPREYRLIDKEGRVMEMEITRSRIDYEGKPAIQSVIRDISERKKRDDEIKKYIREMEILNNMTVERELRMIELKKEINRLLEEMGREKKYKVEE